MKINRRDFVTMAMGLTLMPHFSAEGLEYSAQPLMPHMEDYTHMWWAKGFPSHTPNSPWERCIQTGFYAMALDTEALQIPHFGKITKGLSYSECTVSDNHVIDHLPPAKLELSITADGKKYHCREGGKWTDLTGPRLIESGRFLQRADVTNLVFTSDDGSRLNINARFETAAWPDRLGLILAARPGMIPIQAGEACFGRVGGGYGLNGANYLEIPDSPELDTETFTLEFWVYVPTDYQVTGTFPWVACKNGNEEADGNYGIVILNDIPQARMNIGGGRKNEYSINPSPGHQLNFETWNQMALSYDGDTMRFYLNGNIAGELKIGRKRSSGQGNLTFGRRQDNSGDGYHLRGAIDEIRIYDHALTPAEVHALYEHPEAQVLDTKPVIERNFRADGKAFMTRPAEQWDTASMEIGLTSLNKTLKKRWEMRNGETWGEALWREVYLAFNPVSFHEEKTTESIIVQAFEWQTEKQRPVDFDAARGWHSVNLDGIIPIIPPGEYEKRNDAIERVKLILTNKSSGERIARLRFEKNATGFDQQIGSPITGISAILRDSNGHPTGIPVQLSKDWHTRPEGGVYAGLWFHGISHIRIPAKSHIELELSIVYGHWGGVAAASHSQLCLIGWGSNQLWDESALGSWGESICYEPDQVQGECAILDVRPNMVLSMDDNIKWNWTNNVGGGDFFRLFDSAGKRIFPARMRTAYYRQGPCLTEVTYAGHTGKVFEHQATVSLYRTDDMVRGIYRLRIDIKKPFDFSRFVIFQIGADTYSYTGERKMAYGNEYGLMREWNTHWGGDVYRTKPMECTGRTPWMSLHQAVARSAAGAWSNRGIVIRSWNARIGGKRAAPWIAEHGVNARGEDTSTMDIIPPPGVSRLRPGDYIEATFEHIIMPQFEKDYYGPNEALHNALTQWENTWRMILREAVGNARHVSIKTGSLELLYPDIRIHTKGNRAEFKLAGGLGYVPITFTGLTIPDQFILFFDGKPVDQSIHGNDFWQTDYDPASRSWSRTYNLPINDDKHHHIKALKST
jgi:uncharacterized protein YwbE